MSYQDTILSHDANNKKMPRNVTWRCVKWRRVAYHYVDITQYKPTKFTVHIVSETHWYQIDFYKHSQGSAAINGSNSTIMIS